MKPTKGDVKGTKCTGGIDNEHKQNFGTIDGGI